ncbi:MAG: branched-chain amino acid ABC transporter permease [Burkholderiaceae bacterium]
MNDTLRSNWQKLIPVLIAFAALAIFPLFGSSFYTDLVGKIMILAIFAMSLELLVGQTGLVSFGHAAFFGIGAYAVALVTAKVDAASLWLVLPVALLAAGAYASIVGALSLRTRGVYFIMITLAFAQMAFFVFHDTPFGGGSDGIYLYYKPALTLGSLVLVDFEKGRAVYYATLVCLVGTFGFLAVLLRSRYGRALAGIKSNEQRMRAAGFSTYPYKLGAFVLGAMIASLAGVLFAMKDGVVNPELLAWNQSGAVLLMIILGGLGHLRGAMLGALAFTVLQEVYQSEALFGSFAKHWQLMLGLTIIAFVAALPRGLIGLFSRKPAST